jgi:polyisoprenoid-binding protein YceI
MRTRTWAIIGGGATLLIVAVVAGVIWFSGDAPEEANLADAVASVDGVSGHAGSTGAGAALTGTWVLAASGDSFAGYRVTEELAGVGAGTAVGRTRNLKATLQFDGRAITQVTVEVDLTTLQSDKSLRDSVLRREALETDTFSTATFVLAEPIALDTIPEEGVPLTVMAVGDLTLHGVTKRVSLSLHGQREGALVVVAGSTEVAFADYGIVKPRAPGLTVADTGTIELQLILQRGSQG